MAPEVVDARGRLLNHVELVYRPGERKLAGRLFEQLGCSVLETGGPFLVIQVQPESGDVLNNVLYASEVTPEQWSFETRLREALAAGGPLGESFRGFEAERSRAPQRTTHFGIRMASAAQLEETLERLRTLRDPDLDGRLRICGVFRPGDPGSLSETLIQAFVQTDVCAAGLLALGQHIELQAQLD